MSIREYSLAFPEKLSRKRLGNGDRFEKVFTVKKKKFVQNNSTRVGIERSSSKARTFNKLKGFFSIRSFTKGRHSAWIFQKAVLVYRFIRFDLFSGVVFIKRLADFESVFILKRILKKLLINLVLI